MAWSTQHSAAQWLLPSMIFYRLVCKKSVRGIGFMAIIGAFWTHLSIVGVIVFAPLIVRSKERLKALFKDGSLLALLFFGVLLLYYGSKAANSIPHGFLLALWPMEWALPRLIWFYIFEFGILSLLIYSFNKFSDTDEWWLFISTVVVLFAIPFYSVGLYNDFILRVSAIALFLLCIFYIGTFTQLLENKHRTAISVVILYLVIASFTPLNEMYRQFQQVIPQSFFLADISNDEWDRGVERNNPNCAITTIPRDFTLTKGDQVAFIGYRKNYSDDYHLIEKVWKLERYQYFCVSPGVEVKQRNPYGGKSPLYFFRDGAELGKFYNFYRREIPAEEMPSISTFLPEQYTGSQHSLFYRFIMKD